MAGTGAQDCDTAMAFMAFQALELCQECRIVSGYLWGLRQCMVGWFAEAPLEHWFAK